MFRRNRYREIRDRRIRTWIIIIILAVLAVFGYRACARREAARKIVLLPKAEKNITIIDGWNLKEIGLYLEGQGFSFGGDLAGVKIKDYQKQYSFLTDAPAADNLEGYIFPDTYRVYASSTLDDVLNKIFGNFDNKLTPQMRQDIAAQKKNVYEILTMASILEKEVKTEADMKIVSGIFWNRIKNGQALQSCATLPYVLGADRTQCTLADTQVDSPYNTFKYRGLPPGPIDNPGLTAIAAAIYPTETDYNYFLTRPDTGAAVFSQTYAEHVRNKAKYLK